jgi:hypothetical protein
MSVAALFTWMITILGGLILLVIWIIEYDREFQSAAATRLPVPVVSAHALLAMGGLLFWIAYLLLDEERLAWAAVAILGTVAVLGLIMAARWIRVYRSFAAPGRRLLEVPMSLRNGTSRCRSSSPTASWPSPPSFWCCSPRLALAGADQPPAQAASPTRRNLTAILARHRRGFCAGARSGLSAPRFASKCCLPAMPNASMTVIRSGPRTAAH